MLITSSSLPLLQIPAAMYDELGYFHHHHPNMDHGIPPSLVDSSSSNDGYGAAEMGLDRLQHQLGFDMDMEPMQNGGWESICYGGYPAPAPDLLNLLELPGCMGNGGQLFLPFDTGCEQGMGGGLGAGSMVFGGVPGRYGVFCGGEEMKEGEKGEMMMMMKGNFATERQRRVQMNGKFNALRSLVPVPTKPDRASIISDAIDYIKELLRTVDELKLLVDKKRRGQQRSKKLKAADETAAGNGESSTSAISPKEDRENTIDGPLRSSWLQRRSKETFVDVRIIEDEVNIKLTQKKKAGALLFAAVALDELRLDLNHVAGGNIGDYHIFMFNAKICEGSSVYAGAVANKLLEAMARPCLQPNVHP